MSDIGIETSTQIIDKLRERMKKEKIEDEEEVKKSTKRRNARNFRSNRQRLTFKHKAINNTSNRSEWSRKTTSIGK